MDHLSKVGYCWAVKSPQDHTSLPRPEARYRARELGVPLGRFRPGKWNAITDVEGVLVGHSTIIRGAGPLRRGKGPVRTGVTAILPNEQNVFEQRLIGGGFVLNGAGEVSGMTQLIEWGLVETPIFLTNTLSVGQVSDAAVQWMVDQFPGIGDEHDVLIPLVGECDDSWLNDVAGRHVLAENVLEALHTASSGPVAVAQSSPPPVATPLPPNGHGEPSERDAEPAPQLQS